MTCESVYVASAGGWVNRNDCKGTPTCGMRLTYGGPAVTFADPFPDPSEIPDSYPGPPHSECILPDRISTWK